MTHLATDDTASAPTDHRPVDDWTALRRFLLLGCAAPRYHASAAPLTRASAAAVERCIRADGVRTVAEIVRVSAAGRAPKDDPAVFALAMAAGLGDTETRRAALDALPRVARTGTQLLRFATYVREFRGWGRSLRRAVARWYAAAPVEALARETVEGLTHRDLLRLSHPARRVSAGNPCVAVSAAHARLFDWIARGGSSDGLPRLVEGFVRARSARAPAEAARLVADYRLPREAVRPEHLAAPDVWEALLPDISIEALLGDLPKLTRVGVLAPGSAGTAAVVARLGDASSIRASRVHPIAVLAALRAYAGRGRRGRSRWAPVAEVVDTLQAAFAAAFANVEPTGGRVMVALDVSESMAWGHVAGAAGLTPRDASAAMALVTAATEPRHEIVGFFAHDGLPDGLTPLEISPRHRLDEAIAAVDGLPFGTTDCALPMLYARALEREVDTFVVYTDAHTGPGDVHPAQALGKYRAASGIDARLVVVGMASNGFAIADPADAGVLDVVGFDAATPRLIADFARRAI
jgi:60 kDa SS-A/Ro ribonucleoprotein